MHTHIKSTRISPLLIAAATAIGLDNAVPLALKTASQKQRERSRQQFLGAVGFVDAMLNVDEKTVTAFLDKHPDWHDLAKLEPDEKTVVLDAQGYRSIANAINAGKKAHGITNNTIGADTLKQVIAKLEKKAAEAETQIDKANGIGTNDAHTGIHSDPPAQRGHAPAAGAMATAAE